VQNLSYTYDAAGNITHIRDDAQQTVFFSGVVAEPSNDYTYDALYRLTVATGREQAGNTAAHRVPEGPWPTGPIPNNATLRRYTQRYQYDAVGNFVVFRHIAHGQGAATDNWQRHYRTALDSNRLLQTRMGDSNWATPDLARDTHYRYDPHGSMLNVGATPADFDLHWDHRDMIRHINLQGGGKAWYQYDSGKQRIRKFVGRNGDHETEDRLYLGGFERYRRTRNHVVVEEIVSHHLFEGEQRNLLVDDVISTYRTHSGGTPYRTQPVLRYQYGNHLGSVGVELDEAARVISHEEIHPYGTSAYRQTNDATVRAPAKRYRYTGMEIDEESGLCYHTARHLLPWLGRWASSDPKDLSDGTNTYAWVHTNPVNWIDPDGTQAQPDSFRSLPPWLQKRILAGETNDQTSNALTTARLKEWRNREPTREDGWEDEVLDTLTLGAWSVGRNLAENYFAVSDAPATSDINPVAKSAMAAGMTAGDVTGTRDIVEGLREQDTLNTRTLSPDESFSRVIVGSKKLLVNLALATFTEMDIAKRAKVIKKRETIQGSGRPGPSLVAARAKAELELTRESLLERSGAQMPKDTSPSRAIDPALAVARDRALELDSNIDIGMPGGLEKLAKRAAKGDVVAQELLQTEVQSPRTSISGEELDPLSLGQIADRLKSLENTAKR
jgi:RHS repeat-associated protein